MAELSARERARLPDSAFAYIDSSGQRRLPIHDEAHVRNALARFNRVLFDDEASRDRARVRLLRAAKRHGIVPVGFIEGQLRPRLPGGHLTLLFADIEDSSLHVAELGDRYGTLLSTVRRIQRRAIRAAGGHEVDARGDEIFAVFTTAAAAVDAAMSVVRGTLAHDWGEGRRVRVRIGIHSGRPAQSPSGYHGMSVNTASRLCAAAHGDQVILSRATLSALGESPVAVRHLGTHRLRGIPDALDIYQVVAADLPDDFPTLRIADPGERREAAKRGEADGRQVRG